MLRFRIKLITFLSGNLDIQKVNESWQDDTRKKVYFDSLKTSAGGLYKNLASISALAINFNTARHQAFNMGYARIEDEMAKIRTALSKYNVPSSGQKD